VYGLAVLWLNGCSSRLG